MRPIHNGDIIFRNAWPGVVLTDKLEEHLLYMAVSALDATVEPHDKIRKKIGKKPAEPIQAPIETGDPKQDVVNIFHAIRGAQPDHGKALNSEEVLLAKIAVESYIDSEQCAAPEQARAFAEQLDANYIASTKDKS